MLRKIFVQRITNTQAYYTFNNINKNLWLKIFFDHLFRKAKPKNKLFLMTIRYLEIIYTMDFLVLQRQACQITYRQNIAC